MKQCSAKSKRSGERCKRFATPGHNVCAIHGSKSLRGAAHPGFKDGRHGKHLPAHIAKQYEEALSDPNLLDLNEEIALVDVAIGVLLKNVDKSPLILVQPVFLGLVEQRRKLADSEMKRRVAMQNMITAEQAMTLVAAIMGVIKRRVHDRNTLSAITADIDGLIAGKSSRAVEAT